jgi:hypothetical protein
VHGDRDSQCRTGAGASPDDSQFPAVPLPALDPGMCTASHLEFVLGEWAASQPIQTLAKASGWGWPAFPDVATLLDWLAQQSDDWDFRRRGRVERNSLGRGPAYVNGREIPEDLIIASARALGMVGPLPRPAGPFSAIVVLAGLVTACVNRVQKAASLVSEGVHSGPVVILTGHRPLQETELKTAESLGLTALRDEADVAVTVTRQAFRLSIPERSESSEASEWNDQLFGATASYHWPGVDVYVAPSSVSGRRANTADQLRYWSELTNVEPTDRLLLVTTQIYVPFQQLVAARVLGIDRGCGISCTGVDPATAYLPFQPFSGCHYLQEMRSAFCAAAELIRAVRGT